MSDLVIFKGGAGWWVALRGQALDVYGFGPYRWRWIAVLVKLLNK